MQAKRGRKFDFRALSDKDIKSLRILELIRHKGVISRTEISKSTGINVVSISNYMKHYIEKKLVSEKGFDVSTGGRKPELVELSKNDNHVIGVDIAKNKIRVVLADIALDILEKKECARPDKDTKSALTAAAGLVGEIRRREGSNVRAIGVGICADDHNAVGKEAEKLFGAETFAGDRPSCAAFAERGLNKSLKAGEMLYMHSDIGYGVVIKDDESSLSVGDSKYLEPWRESLGAVALAKSDVARGVGTAIVQLAKGSIDGISLDVIIEAARSGDEVGLSIMRSIGMILGLRIAYLVNLFNPASIVIGGGVERAGEMILGPIKKTVGKLSLKEKAEAVQLLPAVLSEEAVSIGAASLAAREIFLEA